MFSTDYRGAEFIVGSIGHNEIDTSPVRDRIGFASGQFGVPFEWVLDIHGEVIDQTFIEECLDDLRTTSIRVELD